MKRCDEDRPATGLTIEVLWNCFMGAGCTNTIRPGTHADAESGDGYQAAGICCGRLEPKPLEEEYVAAVPSR